jgi:hypothetical protein
MGHATLQCDRNHTVPDTEDVTAVGRKVFGSGNLNPQCDPLRRTVDEQRAPHQVSVEREERLDSRRCGVNADLHRRALAIPGHRPGRARQRRISSHGTACPRPVEPADQRPGRPASSKRALPRWDPQRNDRLRHAHPCLPHRPRTHRRHPPPPRPPPHPATAVTGPGSTPTRLRSRRRSATCGATATPSA